MKLICPICSKQLIRKDRSAVCANGHCFDFSRQGYLNLLIKQSVDHGDNKEMVQARTGFLENGSYEFLREKLQSISEEKKPEILADLGCGEGYYTSRLTAAEKYGFDMSRDALKHAAKKDKTTQYVVASVFHLPLEKESCDMAVTCFAPFAGREVERILKKGGIFVFVSPGEDHLIELKDLLYDVPYKNEMKELVTTLQLKSTEKIQHMFTADHDTLTNLFKMTPYYHRTRKEDRKKLEEVDHLKITAQFIIRIYQK